MSVIRQRNGEARDSEVRPAPTDPSTGESPMHTSADLDLPAGIPRKHQGKSVTWAWPYKNGELLGYAVRYDGDGGKAIIPFFGKAGAAWQPGAPPEPRPLFGSDTLDGETTFISEGEKSTAALHSLGLSAVTNLGSRGGVGKSDWSPLTAVRKVTILADNDEAGEAYAQAVTAQLANLAGSREVLVCRFADLPEKADVVDWIQSRLEEAGEGAAWDGYGPVAPTAVDLIRAELLYWVGQTAQRVPEEWVAPAGQEPIPLRPEEPYPAEPYPMAALGTVLSEAAQALHEVIQAPDAMCGQSILGAASLAVQAYVNVGIDGRVTPLSLFCITVGESGERKSAVDTLALGPVRRFQSNLSRQYEQDRLRYRNAQDAYEKERNRILGDRKKSLESKTAALDALGPPPDIPLVPVLVTDDVTYEGIVKLLERGWPSIGLFADEGGKLVGGHAMNPDNALKSAAGLSSFWDGRDVARLRSGDGATLLQGRRVAVHWMIQPKVAQILFGNEILQGQGFLSRCLPTWPESTAGTRLYAEQDLSKDQRIQRYENTLMGILDTPLPLAEGTQNVLQPRCLGLAPDAKRAWIEFHNHVEQQLANELVAIRGFGNKTAEHAARIAGVLGMVEDPAARVIGIDPMQRGIELAQYYLGEVLRVHDAGAVTPEIQHAERVLEWMRENLDKATGPASSYTLRNLCQFGPLPRAKKDVEKTLRILEEHNLVVGLGPSSDTTASTWRVAG